MSSEVRNIISSKTTKYNLVGVREEDGFTVVEREDVQVLARIEKRHFKKGEFFQMTFHLLDLLEDFKGADYKVLRALLKRLEFNNRIKQFNQTTLAQEAGITQPKVSQSLKVLESKNVIFKDGMEWYFSDTFIKYAGNKEQKAGQGKKEVGADGSRSHTQS